MWYPLQAQLPSATAILQSALEETQHAEGTAVASNLQPQAAHDPPTTESEATVGETKWKQRAEEITEEWRSTMFSSSSNALQAIPFRASSHSLNLQHALQLRHALFGIPLPSTLLPEGSTAQGTKGSLQPMPDGPENENASGDRIEPVNEEAVASLPGSVVPTE